MLTRLELWRRARPERQPQTLEPDSSESSADSDRFLTLIPEGGFTFRLLAFDAIESAQAYVQAHASLLAPGEIVAFWALDSESGAHFPAPPSEPREVVVMVRKPGRRDVVQLYSFVDLEAARTFLRDSMADGLDLGLVLLYWAARVSLDEYSGRPKQGSAHRTSPEHASRRLGRATSLPERQREADVEGRTAELGDQPPMQERDVETGPEARAAATRDDSDRPVGDGRRSSPVARFLARVHAWQGWNRLAVLMVAAALLKSEVYDDLKRDREATGRATLIVGLGSVAAAIGAAGFGLVSVAWHAIAGPLGWAAYTGTVYIISRWVIGGRRQTLLRLYQAAGLASSPALLLVLGVVPVYGTLFVLAV